MTTRRVLPAVLLGVLVLAGCSDQAATTAASTVTTTPSSSSSSSSTSSSTSPGSSGTTATGADAEYVREVLDDSPALSRIDRGDLVKIGLMACDTLTSGGSEDVAAAGLRDGSSQFSADEAEHLVDAAQDHLC